MACSYFLQMNTKVILLIDVDDFIENRMQKNCRENFIESNIIKTVSWVKMHGLKNWKTADCWIFGQKSIPLKKLNSSKIQNKFK